MGEVVGDQVVPLHTTKPESARSTSGTWPRQNPKIAVSSGVAWFSGPEEEDTTNADVTAVARLAGEALPFSIVQYSIATESDVEGSSGEAGSSWPGADDTTSAGDTTVAKVVG